MVKTHKKQRKLKTQRGKGAGPSSLRKNNSEKKAEKVRQQYAKLESERRRYLGDSARAADYRGFESSTFSGRTSRSRKNSI